MTKSAGQSKLANAELAPPSTHSDLACSLRPAIDLSSAIGHLHQTGIIQKDIKPANVNRYHHQSPITIQSLSQNPARSTPSPPVAQLVWPSAAWPPAER
jgi:serine/threonine protein kinase